MKEKLKALGKHISGAMKKERAKMKDMSFKEKLAYIWEYYKIAIIGTITVLAILGSIIYSTVINPAPKPFASMLFIGEFYGDFQNELSDRFTEAVVPEDANEEVYVNVTSVIYDDETTMMMEQKIVAMLAAREIDLLVTYEDRYNFHQSNYYFSDLSEFLTADELAALEDRLWYSNTEEDPKFRPYGIYFDACNVDLSEYSYQKDFIIGIMTNTNRPENTAKLLRYLLGME